MSEGGLLQGIEMCESTNLNPMPMWQSWLIFLGAGGIATILFSFATPWWIGLGLRSDQALLLNTTTLLICLIAIAVVLYGRENRPWTWRAIKTRLRIRNITRKQWMLVGVGIIFVDLTYIGLQVTRGPIVEIVPEWFKAPHRADSSINYAGDYMALLMFSGMIFLNVISEELLWRGCILPRQEASHGRNTWWIHGIQWACFHWFKPWDLIPILPGALLYGWLATRTKSMIPGLVLHFGLNGLGIILLAAQVFGSS